MIIKLKENEKATNFIASKFSDETRILHSNSDNIEIMMGSET